MSDDEFSTAGPGLTEDQRETLSRVTDELMKRYTITPRASSPAVRRRLEARRRAELQAELEAELGAEAGVGSPSESVADVVEEAGYRYWEETGDEQFDETWDEELEESEESELPPLTRDELGAALLEVFEFDSDWFIKQELPPAPELEFEATAVSTGSGAVPAGGDVEPLVWSEQGLDDEVLGDLESAHALLSEDAPQIESAPLPDPEPEPVEETVAEPAEEAAQEPVDETSVGEEEPRPWQALVAETEAMMAEREVAELEVALDSALGLEAEAVRAVAATRMRLAEAREALTTLRLLETPGLQPGE